MSTCIRSDGLIARIGLRRFERIMALACVAMANVVLFAHMSGRMVFFVGIMAGICLLTLVGCLRRLSSNRDHHDFEVRSPATKELNRARNELSITAGIVAVIFGIEAATMEAGPEMTFTSLCLAALIILTFWAERRRSGS